MNKDEMLDWVKNNPTIQGYLKEHSRRENLPRKACNVCQFEYNQEDKHICKQ